MSSVKYTRLPDPEAPGLQETRVDISGGEGDGKPREKSAEEQAGFVSRVFFLWVGRIVDLAYRKSKQEGEALQVEDLGAMSEVDRTDHNYVLFKKQVDAQLERARMWDGLAAAGAAVEDRKGRRGRLQWVGRLVYGPNKYVYHCGVEWEDPSHLKEAGDGYWMGEQVFACRPGHGSFVRPKEIRPLVMQPDGTPYTWGGKRPEAPSIGWATLAAFRWPLLVSGLAILVSTAANFVQPEVVRRLTLYLALTPVATDVPTPSPNSTGFEEYMYGADLPANYTPGPVEYVSVSVTEGVIYLVLMVVGQLLQSVLMSWYHFLLQRLGMHVRNVTSAVIYDKSLTVSQMSEAHPDFSVGNKVNLIDKDSERVRELFWTIHDMWAAPAIVVVAIIMLYRLAGATVFSALGSLAIMIPVLAVAIAKMTAPVERMNKMKDRRIKVINELFDGIRIVKYMVWEHRFMEKASSVRDEELHQLKIQQDWFSLPIGIMVSSSAILNATFCIVYVLTGHTLTPEIVFTSQMYFELLRQPAISIPSLINSYITVRESWFRLGRLLESPDQVDHVDRTVDVGAVSIQLDPDTQRAAFVAYVPVPLSTGDKSVTQKAPAPLELSQLAAAVLAAAAGAAVVQADRDEAEQKAKEKGPAHSARQAAVNSEGVSGDDDAAAGGADGDSSTEGEEGADKEKEAGKEEAEKDTPYRVFPKTLLNLSRPLELKKGKLTMVVGSTGCGKTTLINALLGFCDTKGGQVALGGRVAYAQQDAWLRNDTVRHNVTMGGVEGPEQSLWYDTCTDVCQLRSDLAQFTNGDATEIGERGINLSGGQKQRVSLARAVYSDADVYLLDDPLSALDAGTQRRVMDQCVCGVLRGKTVVLTTHQSQYLHRADEVVVLGEGEGGAGDLKFVGTYDELVHSGEHAHLTKDGNSAQKGDEAAPSSEADADTAAAEKPRSRSPSRSPKPELHRMDAVMERLYLSVDVDGDGDDDMVPQAVTAVLADQADTTSRLAGSTTVIQSYTQALGFVEDFVERSDEGVLLVRSAWGPALLTAYFQRSRGITFEEAAKMVHRGELAAVKSQDEDKLMRDEERVIGSMGWRLFASYAQAIGGVPFWLGLVVLLGISQLCLNASDMWLSWWSRDYIPYGSSLGEDARNRLYKIVYGVILLLMIAFWCLTSLFAFTGFRRASRSLHAGMLRHLLDAPMSFFDTTPTGRILNRFTDDMFQIDNDVPMNLFWMLFAISMIVGSIGVQVYSNPLVLVVMAGLGVVYLYTVRHYLPAQRDARRMDSMNRSPILAHFTQTLNGHKTISAYGLQHANVRMNRKHLDASALTSFSSIYLPQYLSVRLAIIGSLIVGAFVGMSVYSRVHTNDNTNASTQALGITYSVTLSFFLSFIVEIYSEFEASMSSVERVFQYTRDGKDGVPQENLDGDVPGPEWPGQDVAVSFKDVALRYRPGLPLVVDGLSFEVKAGERIGLVGHTGVGKSTALIALFRLVEIDAGGITVGGRNIREVALRHLRRQLSMVPQDPLLFRGTVRYNLDPGDVWSDEQVWAALEKVNMRARIESHDGRLAGAVAEKAGNFSVGERALLCLARAMLKGNTRVLLIDEATANIDMQTDMLIQKTIRESFEGYTVITIAHRLQTVIDSDRLFVLDKPAGAEAGRLVETGSPRDLIASRGVFYEKFLTALPTAEQTRLTDIACADDPRAAYLQSLKDGKH